MGHRKNNTSCHQNLKLAICAASIIVLVGCVAGSPGPALVVIDKMVRQDVQPASNEIVDAHILSPHPPYAVDYDVKIHGKPHKGNGRLHLIARGQYHSWSWVVKADTQISTALLNWVRVTQLATPLHGPGEVTPALDWDSMMKRLYQLDTYLLGVQPIPLQIQVRILPREEYHYKETLHSNQALPLMVIIRDPDLKPTSERLELTQTAVVFTIQSVIQGLLADAEWKVGALPKPPKGSNGKLKFYGNQICWGNSANAATVAGLSSLPTQIRALLPHTTNVVRASVVKTNYYLSTHDYSATYSMAQVLVSLGLEGFLKQQGLSGVYPIHGEDLKHINAIIDYCRAFTHYSGDIESHPLPATDIKGGEFSPLKLPPSPKANSSS